MKMPEEGSLWLSLKWKNIIKILHLNNSTIDVQDITTDCDGDINPTHALSFSRFQSENIPCGTLIKLLYLGE